MMKKKGRILFIGAHPDDAEYQCAGTLALLNREGWDIFIATMTPGQAGSIQLNANEISTVRKKEATRAVRLLNGTYKCLEEEDVFILYDRSTILKTIALFREVTPDIVFTLSPSDYMVDHEITSKIAQTACLAAAIPNIKIEGTEPIGKCPYLYYCDATRGKDIYGKEIKSDIFVDISSTIDIKQKMLGCHESQRSWLLKISKVDEYIMDMVNDGRRIGEKIKCNYAEAFRQHRGFSYPADNILQSELGELVHLLE